jgi:hypothetical protein
MPSGKKFFCDIFVMPIQDIFFHHSNENQEQQKIRQRNNLCPPALGKIRVAPDSPGGLHGGIAVGANKIELNKNRALAAVHRTVGPSEGL